MISKKKETKGTILIGTDSFFVGILILEKTNSIFENWYKFVERASFNIKRMRSKTDFFLRGKLTTLLLCVFPILGEKLLQRA